MRLAVTIAAMLSLWLAACHTHKTATAVETTRTSVQTATDSAARNIEEMRREEFFRSYADSVSVWLCADSITTPGGVIYAPTIRIEASNPAATGTATTYITHTDTVEVHTATAAGSTRTGEYSTAAESTAVASPAGYSWLWPILIFIGCTTFIYIYCKRKHLI